MVVVLMLLFMSTLSLLLVVVIGGRPTYALTKSVSAGSSIVCRSSQSSRSWSPADALVAGTVAAPAAAGAAAEGGAAGAQTLAFEGQSS